MPLPKDRAAWPLEWRERFEECAGKREYEGNMPRAVAERLTDEDMRAAYAREERAAVIERFGLFGPAAPTQGRAA